MIAPIEIFNSLKCIAKFEFVSGNELMGPIIVNFMFRYLTGMGCSKIIV